MFPVVESVDYRQGAKQDELRGLLDRVRHPGKSLEDAWHLDVVQDGPPDVTVHQRATICPLNRKLRF